MHVKEQKIGKPDCRSLRMKLKEESFIYTHTKNPKQNTKAKRRNELTMLTEKGKKILSSM